jgi:4a-hydroxytetrahydrobiopterin dehydratase
VLEENNRLKTFRFKDFVKHLDLYCVSMLAEKMDHHPTWTNTWNVVSFELSTHDAGDIVTDKDRTLAKAIDQLAG